MKNILKALSGKKALMVLLTASIVGSVLEIVTCVRMGTRIDFLSMTVLFTLITVWAVELEKKENKEECK